MTAYEIIRKKRNSHALSSEEIAWFVNGCVSGEIPDYQITALLMAICLNSMNDDETAALTAAMAQSGETLCPSKELGGFCVDKHSTGGVGDKTTLIAVPMCAACGVYVPKMSGRGLGHTGGTIDKLESIPGLSTNLSHEKFMNIVRSTGFAVASQSENLAPADKILYALRNATATVDSIPLICSSIMSKKLATGADGIVLDVKVGDGAFMKTPAEAQALADLMVNTANHAGRKCKAIISDMNKPLGKCVGNALEVTEAAEALSGNGCRKDLYDISCTLAAQMLFIAGKGSYEDCMTQAQNAFHSGKAFEALEKTVALQGGNVEALHDFAVMGKPEQSAYVRAGRSGRIMAIACERTGLTAMELGAGRKTKNSAIDPTAGVVFLTDVGDYVSEGEKIAALYSSANCDIEGIAKNAAEIFKIEG